MNIIQIKPQALFTKDEKNNLRLKTRELLEFLKNQGYAKLVDGKITFIRIKDKIIEQVTPTHIRDFIVEALGNLPDADGLVCFVNEHGKVSCNYLELLPTISLDLKQDTKDTAFFFFRNVFVRITSNGFKCHPYNELDGHIWSSQIIDYDFHPEEGGNFREFLNNLSKNCQGELDKHRCKALCSAIGYLLHRYKDRNKPKAVILTDTLLDKNQANGGSGKTLIAQAISKIRNVRTKDGKHLKNNDKFFYQDVDESTDVLFFDDVSEGFDFSSVFPALTTGIQQEKKYQDVKVIPFEKSPKILIASNYLIRGPIGVSADRRKFEFELSNHYGLYHQPVDDFHHMFFDDWDEGQWNQFFTFMIECLSLYLSEGLIDYDRSQLLSRRLIQETSEEFDEYFKTLTLQKEYNRSEEYRDFTLRYGINISSNLFTRYLKAYSALKGLQFEIRKSNGEYWFKVH